MNEKRLQIKRLFDLQDDEVWKQSQKRKSIYYQQLDVFKYYYVAWKHLTYYIYLDQRFDVPRHHCTTLSFFKRTNLDCKGVVYQL